MMMRAITLAEFLTELRKQICIIEEEEDNLGTLH